MSAVALLCQSPTNTRCAATRPQDNQALRALFSLPPVQACTSTALPVPELPPQQVITGDKEVDAVLWLSEIIKTGQQQLIYLAVVAVQRIKTPMQELQQRYRTYLVRQAECDTLTGALGSMELGELVSQARTAVARLNKRQAAIARFGSVEKLLESTPAEDACHFALHGCERAEDIPDSVDRKQAEARFMKYVDLVPTTLTDCIHAMNYWRDLSSMRSPFDMSDGDPAAHAHDSFCFSQMTTLQPRNKEEALAVLAYMEDNYAQNRGHSPAILRNLISGGWA